MRLQGIVEAGRQSAHVGVEVVDAAGTHIRHVHQRCAREHSVSAASQRKLLLADTSGDGEDVSARRRVFRLGLTARLDGNGSRLGEERHDIDNIVHGLPAVGPAHEVVAAVVVCRTSGRGIGGITVERAESAAVPVDDLVLFDVVVDGTGAGFVRGNKGLGEIQPAVMGPKMPLC